MVRPRHFGCVDRARQWMLVVCSRKRMALVEPSVDVELYHVTCIATRGVQERV